MPSAWHQRFMAASLHWSEAAQHRLYAERKRTLFRHLHGTVLEIGPGTGLNLPYLPDGVDWIGVEPNPHMRPYIERRAAEAGITVRLLDGRAEALSLPDDSVDTAISTLVLCSVADPVAVLAEIRRVLKPGGTFVFIEHVAAETRPLFYLQRAIKPAWRWALDGCCPDRTTGEVVREAGFSEVRFERERLPVPIVAPHIIGRAVN